MPVLTPRTGEAAAYAAHREGEAPRVEVGQRLLLDGIHGEGGQLPVCQADDATIPVLLRVAEPSLPWFNHTHSGADDTSQGIISERLCEP